MICSTTTTTTTSTTTTLPTAAQLKAGLRSQLAPTGRSARITALLKRHGYRIAFSALSAGAVVIDWYHLPKAAHLATSKAKPALVAAGKRTFQAAGTLPITIRLTANGKRLLTYAARIGLTAKGTFTAGGTPAVTATKSFTLTC